MEALLMMTCTMTCYLLPAQALGDEPDYDDTLLQTAVTLLNNQHAYAAADVISGVLTEVAKTPSRLAKKQRTAASSTAQASIAAAAASTTAGGTLPAGAELDAQIQALVTGWSKGLRDSPKTYQAADEQYKQALEPLAVGVFDATAPGAYNSQFNALASQPEGTSGLAAFFSGTEVCGSDGDSAARGCVCPPLLLFGSTHVSPLDPQSPGQLP